MTFLVFLFLIKLYADWKRNNKENPSLKHFLSEIDWKYVKEYILSSLKKKNDDKMNSFSVALGLFDYINPVFYTITVLTIITHLKGVISPPLFVIFVIGACISVIFGLAIPTVKFIVGLGIMEFKMPVNLVFYVNSGILISGLALFSYVFQLPTLVSVLVFVSILCALAFVLYKTKKFNTIAVLIGACGYLLIYATLIVLSVRISYYVPVVLYAIAIALFVMLVLIGILSDLNKPKVHWTIEISNVLCQMFVAIATVLLFNHF